MLTIPTPTEPFSTSKVSLEGVDYVLVWEWNMRLGWLLGMRDVNDDVIFQPKRLVPNWDLLRGVTDARRPRGMLLCYDASEDPTPPTFESLGVSHKVYYVTEEEKDSLG